MNILEVGGAKQAMAEIYAKESATSCQGGHGEMLEPSARGLLQLHVSVCVPLSACDVLTGLA